MRSKKSLYFLLIPFFMPYSLKYISGLTIIYDLSSIFKLLNTLCIFYLFFRKKRIKRISKVLLLIILMNGCLLASSVLNNLTDTEAYTNLLPMLALPMLIELGLERGEIDTVLEIIFKILATLTIINY